MSFEQFSSNNALESFDDKTTTWHSNSIVEIEDGEG